MGRPAAARLQPSLGTVFGALCLVAAMLAVPLSAQAQTAPVGASTTTDGATVLCAWQLPDMDQDAANGVQYVSPVGHADDDPYRGPGDVPPCTGDTPNQTGGSHTIQVIANPGDDPGLRAIELWTAVGYPSGVADDVLVYWDVFYPDGNFKTRILGSALSPGQCAQLGLPAAGGVLAPGSVLDGALVSGQLDRAAADALVYRCTEGVAGFYVGGISLSHHEPCGEYGVEQHAVSPGSDSVLATSFDVDCYQYLSLDASGIDWGTIEAGRAKSIRGDLDVVTAAAPSLVNQGSGGARVGIRFTPMHPIDPATGAALDGPAIDEFGAALATGLGDPRAIDPLPAAEIGWLGSGPNHTLCAGEIGRLDLTIHPPGDLRQGAYRGGIQVFSQPAGVGGSPSPCNNDKGAFGGPWGGASGNQRGTAAPVPAPAPIEAPEVLSAGVTGPDPTSGDSADTDAVTGSTTTTTTTKPTGSTTTTTKPGGGTGTGGGGTTTSTVPRSTTTTTAPSSTTTTTTAPASTTTSTLPPGGAGAGDPGGGGDTGTPPDTPQEPQMPLPYIELRAVGDAAGIVIGFEYGVVFELPEVDPVTGEPIVDPDAEPPPPIADADLAACFPLLDIDLDENGLNDGDLDANALIDLGEVWVYECGGVAPEPPPAPETVPGTDPNGG
jgi:hypothetical protein